MAPVSGDPRPHVVVLGAGFAGLQAAKKLRRADVRITIVDRHNHHLFQPLLYQVATASLQPAEIAGPIRQVIRGRNVSVLMGEALCVDVPRKCVQLADRDIPFDYLVIATGSTHSYFGHPEWAEIAPGLKTLDDAVEIRRRILFAFEAAERELDPARRRAWLTFVVVGGGPTGVELAGALAEIARQTRVGEFRNIDPRSARIILLEGLPRLLSAYPERLSDKAQRALERRGVEVYTRTLVTALEPARVSAGEQQIAARTILWAAGVAASPVVRSLGVELDRAGRVCVTPSLTVPGHDDIFVVGDLAAITVDGRPVPGLAPAAMAEGKHAARNILRALQRRPMQPFRYWDRGSFAVIGRGAAIGVAFRDLQIAGYPAWLAWLAIHIAFLVGFRNRIAVLFNWAYAYITRRRFAQLIVGEVPLAAASHATPACTDADEPRRAPAPPPRSLNEARATAPRSARADRRP